ncbi:MAG: hypothetical protein ABEN55_09835 [Bradymonadaceae bacterium]
MSNSGEQQIREIRDDREELKRVREAGAASAAVIRHEDSRESRDRVWDTDVVGFDYTESLVVEGSFPFGFPPDLPVFVAKPLPEGRRLVEEIGEDERPNKGSDAPTDQGELEREFIDMVTGGSNDSSFDWTELRNRFLERARTSSKYRITEGYDGIQFAKVVAINVRNEHERDRGEALAEQIRDLRRDDELYEELLSPGGDRRQITIRVVDLSDPDDSGVRDLVRRIAREFDKR